MEIINFLSDLRRNNDREWFAQNRDRYETSLAQFRLLVQQVIERLGEYDPEIRYFQAKDCIYRIYRDTRFSADKTPYKTYFGAYIAQGGRKSPLAGYYIHLQPHRCMLASGIWGPESPVLRKMRQAIDVYHPELEQILAQPEYVKYYHGRVECWNKLKKLPAGFPKDHPAAEFLKMKEMFAFHYFKDSLVEDEHFVDYCVDAFRAVMPFKDWCNENVFDL